MIVPLVLIVLGVVFFAASLGFVPYDVLNVLWPLLVVVIGLGMLSNRFMGGGCCEDGTCMACKLDPANVGKKNGKKRRKR